MSERDSKLRSWTKSFTWRVLGMIILMGLGYLFTGNIVKATWITLSFDLIRTFLYYIHERIWERISWGKYEEPKDKFWFYFWLIIFIITFLIVIYLALTY